MQREFAYDATKLFESLHCILILLFFGLLSVASHDGI